MGNATSHDPKRGDSAERACNLLDINKEEPKSAVSEVELAIDNERRGRLQDSYQIGVALARLYRRKYPGDQGNSPQREDRFFEELGNALGVDDWWLRDLFRLARAFDGDQFERLCQNPTVTLKVALDLAEIDDDPRGKVVEQIANGLPAWRAALVVQKAPGSCPATGQDRLAEPAELLEDSLVGLRTHLDLFISSSTKVWFSDDYGIVNEIQDVPAHELTDDHKLEIAALALRCDELAAKATKDAAMLRRSLPKARPLASDPGEP